MNRSAQLVLVLMVATVIAATGSHLLAGWLKIKTTVSEPLVFGKPNGHPPAYRSGSSLSDYGIQWEQIATQLNLEIKAWGIAAGSPYESEQFQKQVPEARTTFIVVSTYDMDEANISDFRAALVPLSKTFASLRAIHADWQSSKRALSEYPVTWLRILFPTLGRSRGIMGRMHEKVVNIIKPSAATFETQAGPMLDVGKEKVVDSYRLQRVSDWSKSQVIGKLAAENAGFQGSHAFNGLKDIAFERMLEYGCERGTTIVVVMPVSASYSKEFVSPELALKFETAMTNAQNHFPQVEWFRLDQLSGLDSDQNFCDLVHMNVFGQKIATEAFQVWLAEHAHQP